MPELPGTYRPLELSVYDVQTGGRLTARPLLPEVERVRIDIEAAAQGKKISSVDANEDTIIFDGISSDEFQQALQGRRLVSCERRGKK